MLFKNQRKSEKWWGKHWEFKKRIGEQFCQTAENECFGKISHFLINVPKPTENLRKCLKKFWRNFWESLRNFLRKSETFFYQGMLRCQDSGFDPCWHQWIFLCFIRAPRSLGIYLKILGSNGRIQSRMLAEKLRTLTRLTPRGVVSLLLKNNWTRLTWWNFRYRMYELWLYLFVHCLQTPKCSRL